MTKVSSLRTMNKIPLQKTPWITVEFDHKDDRAIAEGVSSFRFECWICGVQSSGEIDIPKDAKETLFNIDPAKISRTARLLEGVQAEGKHAVLTVQLAHLHEGHVGDWAKIAKTMQFQHSSMNLARLHQELHEELMKIAGNRPDKYGAYQQ